MINYKHNISVSSYFSASNFISSVNPLHQLQEIHIKKNYSHFMENSSKSKLTKLTIFRLQAGTDSELCSRTSNC